MPSLGGCIFIGRLKATVTHSIYRNRLLFDPLLKNRMLIQIVVVGPYLSYLSNIRWISLVTSRTTRFQKKLQAQRGPTIHLHLHLRLPRHTLHPPVQPSWSVVLVSAPPSHRSTSMSPFLTPIASHRSPDPTPLGAPPCLCRLNRHHILLGRQRRPFLRQVSIEAPKT